ncbi:unnamed protein product [Closterium sp. NIES-54]
MSRPTAARASHSAAPRVTPCCSPHVAPYCPARRTLLQPAHHALLQPVRRALLPCASRPAAASASRPTAASASCSAALRVAPCCSQRVAPYCSQRVALYCPACPRALLPCPPRCAPCPAETCRPARAAMPNPSRAALPRSPTPPSRPAATTAATAACATVAAGGGAAGSAGSAAGAGGAGGATGSARGAAGAGAARGGQRRSLPLPDDPTPQQLREGVLQRARPGGGGFCFLRTAQRRQQSQQEKFSPQVLSELYPQRCVTGSNEAAALGASESAAALGASESAATLGASESAAALGARASLATSPSSAEALHTFTLDSGASHCFFHGCTTLTPLAALVPVSQADPTGGPVVARASTVLPCPAVPSGSVSGLHLPTFLTNLVSNAAIQDVWVDILFLEGSVWQSVLSASGHLAVSCSCRVLSYQTLLWHHRLGHPSLQRLRSTHSRLLERYFLLVVDDYTRYTTFFPLRRKACVSGVLIPWIRATRRQLRERFSRDFPVLRLHSDRVGEFSSDLLVEFCRDEGILQSFTLPASPQQNGVVERCIGLIMEVARTSMIHAAAPHFLWPFAVRYAVHQLNLWPRVSKPETLPTLWWTGKVGDALVFRV